MTASPGTISRLLINWREGDQTALDHLIPLVYSELHRLAHYYLRRQKLGHTLETTELIDEAYLRLVDHKNMRWQNRAHFYAVAAQAMRRILVDRARTRVTAKRGGGEIQISLDEGASMADERAAELLVLDEALNDLAKFDERKSRVVELRYFGGLSVEETAKVLSISPVTVMREWRAAKGWLLRAVSS
jgi:RNA polymerase sigma factor (TIGR02999 family)